MISLGQGCGSGCLSGLQRQLQRLQKLQTGSIYECLNAVMMNRVCLPEEKRKRRGANGRRGSSSKYKKQGERLGEVLQDMYLKMCMVIPVLMMTSLQMGNLHWSMSCIVGPTGYGKQQLSMHVRALL